MKALIIAGEASGDLYGGQLAASLLARDPSLQLAGMGSERMADAGVHLLYDARSVSVVGVFEVASKLKHLRRAFHLLKEWALREKPDFAVLIDFPDFNFRMARTLKKLQTKIYYFISPQIWAWRKNRIHFLKQHVDLMITILPFEKQLYEAAGVSVMYVGHPLAQMVREEVQQQPPFERGSKPLIGLMPGSRDTEVRRHLPLLLSTVELIRRKQEVSAILIWPSSLPATHIPVPPTIQVVHENRYAAMKACDLMLVASGTSTLECAILGVPMLIVYRIGGFSWQLGKALVRVPYYGLVNWIAQKKVVPEYIQKHMNPELLAADAMELLTTESKREEMRSNLAQITDSLGPDGAIERAVDAILERVQGNTTKSSY
jgi:lipid-A-disaccharide synthase